MNDHKQLQGRLVSFPLQDGSEITFVVNAVLPMDGADWAVLEEDGGMQQLLVAKLVDHEDVTSFMVTQDGDVIDRVMEAYAAIDILNMLSSMPEDECEDEDHDHHCTCGHDHDHDHHCGCGHHHHHIH